MILPNRVAEERTVAGGTSTEETLVERALVERTERFIVQSHDTDRAAIAVRSVGAEPSHELGVLRAV
ncbi:MAG: hypothetical protein AAGE94_23520, partial [Acidobacteriota bacterium]